MNEVQFKDTMEVVCRSAGKCQCFDGVIVVNGNRIVCAYERVNGACWEG